MFRNRLKKKIAVDSKTVLYVFGLLIIVMIVL